jgi:Ca2+-binding EF-hand superfamily protein
VDSNNNSLIERAELRAAVTRRLGKDPSEQLLDAMVAALDDNGFCFVLFFIFWGESI